MFSPDGKWIAFVSDCSGTAEVFVKSFPALEDFPQVSLDGGEDPLWARDGTALYYWEGDTLMAVAVQQGSAPVSENAAPLFTRPYVGSLWGNYDISPDGRRFILIDEPAGRPRSVRYVANWFEELRRSSPTGR